MVGNDYTDKLICTGKQSDRGTMMTSISFYLDNLGNRRRVLPTHAIKSRVGKLKTRVGKLKKFFGALRRIFSKNLCPPLPESVPAPLTEIRRGIKKR